MIIAVDFDMTIAKTKYPEILSLMPNVDRYLHKWKRKGHRLVLWTSREGQLLHEAIEFCNKYGIKFDAVNESLPTEIKKYGTNPRKIGFDYLIDDKCPMPVHLQFSTLDQILGG